MTSTPVISVVIPTRNRNDVLGRAVRSVLAQTLAPLEVIVVDDAGEDDPADVLASFDDARIRLIRHTEAAGAGGARNAGAAAARGDWIAFQDSDDAWLIHKLEAQTDLIAEGIDLICCGYITLPCERRPWLTLPAQPSRPAGWNVNELFDFSCITPTWLIRRDRFLSLGGFDTELPNLEDWEFVFRLRQGLKIHPDALVIKYGRWDALNTSRAQRLASLEMVRAKHQPLWRESPATHARLLNEIGRMHRICGDSRAGLDAAWEAFRTHASRETAGALVRALGGSWGRRLRRRQRLLQQGRSA